MLWVLVTSSNMQLTELESKYTIQRSKIEGLITRSNIQAFDIQEQDTAVVTCNMMPHIRSFNLSENLKKLKIFNLPILSNDISLTTLVFNSKSENLNPQIGPWKEIRRIMSKKDNEESSLPLLCFFQSQMPLHIPTNRFRHLRKILN